jgi:hypothetical protein
VRRARAQEHALLADDRAQPPGDAGGDREGQERDDAADEGDDPGDGDELVQRAALRAG